MILDPNTCPSLLLYKSVSSCSSHMNFFFLNPFLFCGLSLSSLSMALSKKNLCDTKDSFSVLWFGDFPIVCVCVPPQRKAGFPLGILFSSSTVHPLLMTFLFVLLHFLKGWGEVLENLLMASCVLKCLTTQQFHNRDWDYLH